MYKYWGLLSAAALVGLTANADVNLFTSDTGYKVNVGAEAFFEVGSRAQAQKYKKYPVSPNNEDILFQSNTAIHLSVSKDHQNGWQSGIQVGLKAKNNVAVPVGNHYLDRTYLWTENKNYGRIEAGSNVSAANSMRIDADIFGGWESYVSLETNAISDDNFITSPSLILKEKDFDFETSTHERSRKITYYTPKYKGFQYGISYIPDVWNNGGRVAMPQQSIDGDYNANRREKNAVATGLAWEHDIGDKQSVEVSLVGEIAKIERSGVDKLNNRTYYNSAAAALGATYNYDRASFTAAYGNQWKTRIQKGVSGIPDGYFVNVGAGYKLTEKLNLSTAVFYSRKYNNPMIVAGFYGDYKWMPGLLPYANIVFFQMWQKNNYNSVKYTLDGNSSLTSSDASNNGVAFILGTKVKF